MRGTELNIDLITSFLEEREEFFWDILPGAVDTWGGYVHLEEGGLSLWALSVNNERVAESLVSRSPSWWFLVEKVQRKVLIGKAL